MLLGSIMVCLSHKISDTLRIGGGVEYIREHDQFSKADTGSGGAFWKSIWRYTPVIQQ